MSTRSRHIEVVESFKLFWFGAFSKTWYNIYICGQRKFTRKIYAYNYLTACRAISIGYIGVIKSLTDGPSSGYPHHKVNFIDYQ